MRTRRCVGLRGLVASVMIAATAVAAVPAATPAAASTADNVAGPVTFGDLTNVPRADHLYDVSCPTSSLCVAVGGYDHLGPPGYAAWSTDPTGGASTWTTNQISTGLLTAVSCPSESFCVATGYAGAIYSSTDPTGGASAWQKVSVPGLSDLRDVDCPSTSLCLAIDAGQVAVSTNPTGGASAWTVSTLIAGGQLTTVSCAGTSMCVAAGYDPSSTNHHVMSSTNPSAGLTSWSQVDLGSVREILNLSCPTTSLCVGAGDLGNVVTSTDPTGDASAWKSTRVDGYNIVTSMSCPSSRLCVAVDQYGKVLTSTDPTGGASAWNVASMPDGPERAQVSCSSAFYVAPICVAATIYGTVMAGTRTVPGRLRVTTSPALPSKITIDGQVANTWGLEWVKLTPGQHEVCLSDVQGYTTPGCRTLYIVSGLTTTWNATFVQRGYLKVVTSPAVPSAISIDGHPANDWGVYTDVPVGNHLVCFGAVAGMNPPPCQNAQVTAGTTKTVTGNFTTNPAAPGPTNVGTLRVTTTPPVASQISVDGHIANTWGLNWLQLAPGEHEVCFRDVAGHTTPDCETATVGAGHTTTVDGVFTQNGYLKIETDPAWDKLIQIDGGPANDWGAYTDVTPGQHRVCYEEVYSPWYGPGCQDVTVTAGATTTLTGTYSSIIFP